MTGEERTALDERIRAPIREALASGAAKWEIVFLLTRMLPELADRSHVAGQVAAAYHLSALRRK